MTELSQGVNDLSLVEPVNVVLNFDLEEPDIQCSGDIIDLSDSAVAV